MFSSYPEGALFDNVFIIVASAISLANNYCMVDKL